MSRLQQVRIVQYSIKPDIALEWGISEDNRHKIGVIAQEMQQIIPDAVKEDGEYLTVDDVCTKYRRVRVSAIIIIHFTESNIL